MSAQLKKSIKIERSQVFFYLALFIGILLRLRNIFLHQCEPNTDIFSYEIVIDLLEQGKSVYANTVRYNYGPIWFSILAFLKLFSGKTIMGLYYSVISFLVLVDLCLAFLLYYFYGFWSYFFFLVSPASIAITGYHGQFDNLAVLLGFIGFLVGFSDEKPKIVSKKWYRFRFVISGIFFGLSLMTKHLLIFFLPWLLMKMPEGNQIKLKNRVQIVLIATILFGVGFLPWIFDLPSRNGILHNVINYTSDTSKQTLFSYLNQFVFPANLNRKLELNFSGILFPSDKLTWILMLMLSGYFVMRKNLKDSFFQYLFLLVGISPAIANQYFAIPALSCAVFYRVKAVWVYLIMTLPMAYYSELARVFPKANWPITEVQKQFWLFLCFVSILLMNNYSDQSLNARKPKI